MHPFYVAAGDCNNNAKLSDFKSPAQMLWETCSHVTTVLKLCTSFLDWPSKHCCIAVKVKTKKFWLL